MIPKLCATAPQATTDTMEYFQFLRETLISQIPNELNYFTLLILDHAMFLQMIHIFAKLGFRWLL